MKSSIVAKLEALQERHEEVLAHLAMPMLLPTKTVSARYHVNMRN